MFASHGFRGLEIDKGESFRNELIKAFVCLPSDFTIEGRAACIEFIAFCELPFRVVKGWVIEYGGMITGVDLAQTAVSIAI